MVCQDVLLLLSAFLLSMLQQMVQLWPTEFKGFCLSKVIWLKYFPLSCAVTSLASITGGGGGEACKWQELVWYCTQPVFLQQCTARYCSDARAIVTMQMQCQYNVSDNISGKILSTSSVLAIPNTRVIPSVTKRLARFVRGLSTPCSKFEPPLLSCQRYFNPPG